MSIRTKQQWKREEDMVWGLLQPMERLKWWREAVVAFKLLSFHKGKARAEVTRVEYMMTRAVLSDGDGGHSLSRWQWEICTTVQVITVEIFPRIEHHKESLSSDRDLLVISERVETKTQRQHPGQGLNKCPGGFTYPG